jgi:hypothetical protein
VFLHLRKSLMNCGTEQSGKMPDPVSTS